MDTGVIQLNFKFLFVKITVIKSMTFPITYSHNLIISQETILQANLFA